MLRLIGFVIVFAAFAIVYALRPRDHVSSPMLSSFAMANGIPLAVVIMLAIGCGLLIGLH